MQKFNENILTNCLQGTVIIWGSGDIARCCSEIFDRLDITIKAVVDNNVEKQGKLFGILPIAQPSYEILSGSNTYIIVTAKRSLQAIENQIIEFGVSRDNIIDGTCFEDGFVPGYILKIAEDRFKSKEYRYMRKDTLSELIACISKCIYTGDRVLLNGWALSKVSLDHVDVIINGQLKGQAHLGELREDVNKVYPFYYQEYSGYSFFSFVDRAEKLDIELRLFAGNELKKVISCACCPNFIDYLRPMISSGDPKCIFNLEKHFRMSKEQLSYYIYKAIPRIDNIEDQIYGYHLLRSREYFNSDVMSGYCNVIEKIPTLGNRCWLVEQEVPWMIFLDTSLIYHDIYQWRRTQLERLTSEIFKEIHIHREKGRVVILLDGLSNEKYASSIFELAIADQLAQRGMQVKVVVRDISYSNDLSIPVLIPIQNDSKRFQMIHESMKQASYEIFYCQSNTYIQRIHEAYEEIVAYAPEFVIDISLAGAVVSAGLKKAGIPVIHIALTGYSSSAVYSRYIAKNKEQCIRENEIYHSINENEIFEAPIKIPYSMTASKEYHRIQVGLTSDDFVLITVGNRLKYELDDIFLEKMKKLLCKFPHIVWVVVGKNLGTKFDLMFKNLIDNRRVFKWGFEDDLLALYELCDTYVNPDRMGGCGSIEMAMEIGMPIALTNYYADITPVIKEENCFKDYNRMFEYIVSLKKSESFRKQESKKMLRLINREELTMRYYVDVILNAYGSI